MRYKTEIIIIIITIMLIIIIMLIIMMIIITIIIIIMIRSVAPVDQQIKLVWFCLINSESTFLPKLSLLL